MMKRLLLTLACLGCITKADQQLAEVMKRQAVNVFEQGCEVGGNKAKILVTASARLADATGAPETPLIVNVAAPSGSDVERVEQAAEDAYKEEAKGWGLMEWISVSVIGSIFGVGAGKKIWGVAKLLRQRKALAGGFVDVVNALKGALPADQKDKAGELARDAARAHNVEGVVQAMFEEQRKNGKG